MTDLKPCPWCRSSNLVPVWQTLDIAKVHCKDCGARGPEAPTEAEAIAAWNTRVEPERSAPADATCDHQWTGGNDGVWCSKCGEDRTRTAVASEPEKFPKPGMMRLRIDLDKPPKTCWQYEVSTGTTWLPCDEVGVVVHDGGPQPIGNALWLQIVLGKITRKQMAGEINWSERFLYRIIPQEGKQ